MASSSSSRSKSLHLEEASPDSMLPVEILTIIFTCISQIDLPKLRLVCRTWNNVICTLLKCHLPEIRIGTGYTQPEADKENQRLNKLQQVMDKSKETFPFCRFFFGRLLNYDAVQKMWESHGNIMQEVTIDCHLHPEHIDIDPEFKVEHLLSFLKYCGPTLTSVRLNLPRDVLESDALLPTSFRKKERNHLLQKCSKLVLQSKLMHNFCETSYTQIIGEFWKEFFGICPALVDLKVDIDLDPEETTSIIPMFKAIKTTIAKQLTILKITSQLSNDELKFLTVLGRDHLNLKSLSLTRFHCTAKGENLQAFLETQKATLETLKIIYNCYYDQSEIEYENMDPPDFGHCRLPEMPKLKRLTISGSSDARFIYSDNLPNLKEYKVIFMDMEDDGDLKNVLDNILPKEENEGDADQLQKFVVYNLPDELNQADMEARVAIAFPNAKFLKAVKNMGRDNYYSLD